MVTNYHGAILTQIEPIYQLLSVIITNLISLTFIVRYDMIKKVRANSGHSKGVKMPSETQQNLDKMFAEVEAFRERVVTLEAFKTNSDASEKTRTDAINEINSKIAGINNEIFKLKEKLEIEKIRAIRDGLNQ